MKTRKTILIVAMLISVFAFLSIAANPILGEGVVQYVGHSYLSIGKDVITGSGTTFTSIKASTLSIQCNIFIVGNSTPYRKGDSAATGNTQGPLRGYVYASRVLNKGKKMYTQCVHMASINGNPFIRWISRSPTYTIN